jgi:hypothetical protein
LVGKGGSLYVTVAVSWQEIQARKLKCSFLIMAYSALFKNVFEAVNLLLIIIILMEQKFSCLAMAFSSSPEHRILARVLVFGAYEDGANVAR